MSSDSSVLNIIEKALLEGLTSKELSQSPSASIYSTVTSTNSGMQINPGNFIPALQSFNPYDETSTTSNVVPYYQSSGSSGFDTSRTLYMFSIKQFSETESTNLTNLINAQSLINTTLPSNISPYGQSMIFDSNANIYSVDAYYEAWCNPSSPSSSLAVTNTNCQSCVSGGISNMDNIVNTIKSNTNYFSFFNPLLKKQPTQTYCIDGNPTKTYSRITMTAPSDRFSETVAMIEYNYINAGTSNYQYLPSNLESNGIYPVYIPSMFFQYFLYKESFSSPWHIIYNPIHRNHYLEYWMNENSIAKEGSDSTRMYSGNTKAHMVNYGNIFKTYRGIKNSTFQSYFVDPICLCVTPLNIVYPTPTLSTSYPIYVGPYVNGSTTIDGTTFSSNNLSSNKDVYSTYTYLNNKQNLYTFPLSQGFGLPESFYQSNTSTTNVPYCWAGCSNNFISPIASWVASDNQQNSYKYSLPVVTLKYSYDCKTFNPITLPLWGLLSFNNFINGRAYSFNGTSSQPIYNCTDLTVENTVCSTILNSSGGINVQNSNLTNMCGGGGQSQSNQTLPTPPTTNQPTTNVDIPASNQPNQPNQLSVQTSNQTNQQSVKIISNKPSSSPSSSSPSSPSSNIKTASSNKNILIIIIIISLIIILAGSFFVYYKFKK